MSLKGGSCWGVNIRMNEAEKLSLEAIGRFISASQEIQFEAEERQQLYGWVEEYWSSRSTPSRARRHAVYCGATSSA